MVVCFMVYRLSHDCCIYVVWFSPSAANSVFQSVPPPHKSMQILGLLQMRLGNMQKASCNTMPRHPTLRLMRPELLCDRK